MPPAMAPPVRLVPIQPGLTGATILPSFMAASCAVTIATAPAAGAASFSVAHCNIFAGLFGRCAAFNRSRNIGEFFCRTSSPMPRTLIASLLACAEPSKEALHSAAADRCCAPCGLRYGLYHELLGGLPQGPALPPLPLPPWLHWRQPSAPP